MTFWGVSLSVVPEGWAGNDIDDCCGVDTYIFRPRITLFVRGEQESGGCYCFKNGKIVLHFTTYNIHQYNPRTGEKSAKVIKIGNTFLTQSLGNF